METRKKQSSVINLNFAEPPKPLPIKIENTDCLGERSIKRRWITKNTADRQKIIDATFKQCESNAKKEYDDYMHACEITGSPCTPQELAQYEQTLLIVLWQCGIDKGKAETYNADIWALNWERVDREYASCCVANPGKGHGCDAADQ